MTLHALKGHERVKSSVIRAFLESKLPRVLLLHGPKGIGKQRLALWIGQLLLCETVAGSGPCGDCRGCQMSLRLEHPDLLWYFPIKRPPSKGSRERDLEALEEVRLEIITQIREQPLRPSYSEEPLGLHLGTVRNLKREAARGPGIAPRKVFLLTEAQELVSQDASPEAANALLKLLEDLPPNRWFVLTSSEPGRLLPTIRSRTTGLYMPTLSGVHVREFLARHSDASETEIQKAASLSGGAIGRALGYLPSDRAPGPLERIRQEAFHLLRAALNPQPVERLARSLSYPPAGARGLHETFSSLESWLRDLAALASSADTPVLNQDARKWLSKTVAEGSIDPVRVAECIRYVEDSRSLAAGNVNPQLILSQMLSDLHAGLRAPTLSLADEVS